MARNTVKPMDPVPVLASPPQSDGARWLVASIPVAAFFVALPMAVSNPNALQTAAIVLCVLLGGGCAWWAYKWNTLNANHIVLRRLASTWIPRLMALAFPLLILGVALIGSDLADRFGLVGETKQSLHQKVIALETNTAILEKKRAHLQGEVDYLRNRLEPLRHRALMKRLEAEYIKAHPGTPTAGSPEMVAWINDQLAAMGEIFTVRYVANAPTPTTANAPCDPKHANISNVTVLNAGAAGFEISGNPCMTGLKSDHSKGPGLVYHAN